MPVRGRLVAICSYACASYGGAPSRTSIQSRWSCADAASARQGIRKTRASSLVLLQRLGRLRIFRRIDRHETIERSVRVGTGRRHPDRLHVGLRACLLRLGQRVQHVAHLMKPTALATCGRKHLFPRRPEAHCAVADRQPWPCLQTALFQVEQKLHPRRFCLAIPIADRNTLFARVRVHANDDR